MGIVSVTYLTIVGLSAAFFIMSICAQAANLDRFDQHLRTIFAPQRGSVDLRGGRLVVGLEALALIVLVAAASQVAPSQLAILPLLVGGGYLAVVAKHLQATDRPACGCMGNYTRPTEPVDLVPGALIVLASILTMLRIPDVAATSVAAHFAFITTGISLAIGATIFRLCTELRAEMMGLQT